MDNHNTSNAYSTAGKAAFKMEIISLKNKIQTEIDASSSKVAAYEDKASQEIATQLGVLKVHKLNLREVLEQLELISEEKWIEIKPQLVEDFEAIYHSFMPQINR